MIFEHPRDLTAAMIAAMRADWHSADCRSTLPRPTERDTSGYAAELRLRDLRFARPGEVLSHGTTGEWYALLAALLTGRLDADTAPCTRRGCPPDTGEVRSLSHVEVDWSAVEPREWAALVRAGLPRATALRLQAGEPVDAPADPEHARAVEAARALLAHVPAGTPAERAEATAELAREVIYGDALAASNGVRRDAAASLGVPPSRVTEAVQRYPALARAWPAGPRGPKPQPEDA